MNLLLNQWALSRSEPDPLRWAQCQALRHERTRLFALPPHIRAYVRLAWARAPRPRRPDDLGKLILHACAALGANGSDFPALTVAARARLTAHLNDKARAGDLEGNCTWQYSAGVRRWLRSGATLDLSEYHLPADRLAELWRGVAECVCVPDLDDRRSGLFAISGERFQFKIHYVRRGSNAESDVPWNADLTVRILLVALQSEDAPEAFGTLAETFSCEGR